MMNSLLSYHYPIPPQGSSTGSDQNGTASAPMTGGTTTATTNPSNSITNPNSSASSSPFIGTINNTTLPSIHSLALPTDVPASHQLQQTSPSSAVMLPPLLSGRFGTSPTNSSLSYSPSYTTNTINHTTTSTNVNTTTNGNSISPISSPSYYQENYRSTSFTEQSQPQSHKSSISSIIPPNQIPSPLSSSNSTISSNDESDSNTDSNSVSASANKKWKPRKKRQCPECKLYFSNLATHKSTHLKPTSRPHICKYCNRGFARSNDLFRHVKCHWKEIGSDKGQFKCPFKHMESSISTDQEVGSTATDIKHEHHNEDDMETTGQTADGDNCCHQTGIFSRCDTFKNHLKAIHFQYPNGTKKDQRTKVAGKCRMCQEEFKNVDDWLSNHIEKNQCPFAVNVLSKE